MGLLILRRNCVKCSALKLVHGVDARVGIRDECNVLDCVDSGVGCVGGKEGAELTRGKNQDRD